MVGYLVVNVYFVSLVLVGHYLEEFYGQPHWDEKMKEKAKDWGAMQVSIICKVIHFISGHGLCGLLFHK